MSGKHRKAMKPGVAKLGKPKQKPRSPVKGPPTIEKLQKQYPELYEAILEKGKKAAIDSVGSIRKKVSDAPDTPAGENPDLSNPDFEFPLPSKDPTPNPTDDEDVDDDEDDSYDDDKDSKEDQESGFPDHSKGKGVLPEDDLPSKDPKETALALGQKIIEGGLTYEDLAPYLKDLSEESLSKESDLDEDLEDNELEDIVEEGTRMGLPKPCTLHKIPVTPYKVRPNKAKPRKRENEKENHRHGRKEARL